MLRRVLIGTVLFLLAGVLPVHATTPVPPGNRNVEQPPIPAGSKKRTRSKRTTFEKKYQRIRNLLARDRKLAGKIRKAAATYGIDPIHIVGALVGEHTYNVDAIDRLQSYYVKALAYLKQDISFRHEGVSIEKLVSYPEFSRCDGLGGDYDVWSCRESVWNRSFSGKKVHGRSWPRGPLGRVFFQPLYAGQTFGLGQLNPLTALKVNDLVRRRSPREPKLSMTDAPRIYETIMEPDSTLLYMAAVIRNSIDVYNQVAGFDISGNPGITATLYNLGNVKNRAAQLRAKNLARQEKGEPLLLPQENYYGWLINEKLADLQSIL